MIRPTGPKLVTFKTWFITVVGPPPDGKSQLNLTNRSTELEWDPYFCQEAERCRFGEKLKDLLSNPIIVRPACPRIGI